MRTLIVRVLRDLREAELSSLPTEFEDYGPSAEQSGSRYHVECD